MTAFVTPGTALVAGTRPVNDLRAASLRPASGPNGLACQRQVLHRPFVDMAAPGLATEPAVVRLRTLAVTATLILAGVLLAVTWLSLPAGLPPGLAPALLVLTAVGLLPVAAGLVLALVGLWRPAAPPPSPLTLPRPPALRVALLLPIHEEDAAHVFGNAAAMLEDLSLQSLRRTGGRHEFGLFVLSDTRSAARATEEARAAAVLRHEAPPGIRVSYRRRPDPVDRKLGNLRDWVETHGADWPAMIVLDADSLMSGRALVQLTDALASDPSAGLIQSVPRIIGARTLFARLQAFSHAAHGGPVAAGFAAVCGDAGNYFGHNAILRTRAFADAATLPALPGWFSRKPAGLILSHDFVEAALLRRAGWGVRVMPGITDSYEETPPTLVDHALRDRRWCRGNLQHLRLIGAAGLHPLSRAHLVLGALAYLAAPAWVLLMAGWALAASLGTPAAPQAGLLAAGLVLLALVVPRLLALLQRDPDRPRARAVVGAFALSALYAPVQMVQVTLAVVRAALGLKQGWAPQNRGTGHLSVLQVAAFHRVETLSGVALLGAVGMGLVTPWIAAVAVPLVLAVPLSIAGGLRTDLLATPEDVVAPDILRAATVHRAALRRFLDGADTWAPQPVLAAE
ncbi:MAG: glucans biosynthesis glucosyltransferase MdoH [Rhodobacteraceae bacterium]|jgi:membrane glycosyltransferase|nr:glucans biosynthesis glucosyltransferase MdoH [Paracoccaceae bacterium]